MGFQARKNIHIENWAAFRENCEHSFKFSRVNWARFLVFGIGVPVLAYVAIAGEMENDKGHTAGRGAERFGLERKFLGRQGRSPGLSDAVRKD